MEREGRRKREEGVRANEQEDSAQNAPNLQPPPLPNEGRSSHCGWDNLPKEIDEGRMAVTGEHTCACFLSPVSIAKCLVLVFAQLATVESLAGGVPLVCKQWHAVWMRDELWRCFFQRDFPSLPPTTFSYTPLPPKQQDDTGKQSKKKKKTITDPRKEERKRQEREKQREALEVFEKEVARLTKKSEAAALLQSNGKGKDKQKELAEVEATTNPSGIS